MSTINTYSDIDRRDKLISKFKEVDETIYVELVDISKANILGMFAAPVEVIAGAGAGKVIELVSATLVYDYDTAAYGGGGVVTLGYTSGAVLTNNITAANSFGAAGDKVYKMNHLSAAGGYNMLVNTGISIKNITGAFTDPGTAAGVGRLRISYRVHSTGL